MKRRVAILTPWFGDECTGGAETQARELACRLADHGDAVTVLTTTSRSFLHDWGKNYHKPGRARERNYQVIRFPVRARNGEAFATNNEQLLGLPPERWSEVARYAVKTDPFVDESINSPELQSHVRRLGRSRYDAIVALPYLYGVVVNTIETAETPIHLIPCLHDEAYARIPRIEEAFHRAKTLLFNSAGEMELGLRLYGPGIMQKSYVVGEGLENAAAAEAAEPPVHGRYYLYLGRREPEKGIERLIDAFHRYRNNGSRVRAELVLAGPGPRCYSDELNGIRDLGFVDESAKVSLLRHSVALLNPSRNESYSRVLMEAWREQIPVVVDGQCLATAAAVQESRAGFVATNAEEWVAALHALDEMSEEQRDRLGGLGAQYAAENADWNKSVARLRAALGFDARQAQANGKRIDQILEGFDRGDAISDEARGIANRLRHLGYQTNIYAPNIAPGIQEASALPRSLDAANAVIFHHSIGSDVADRFTAARTRKAVIYHNVTPAHFFEPYRPDVAEQLERGRKQLTQVVAAADICVGDSDYNADEMRALGAKEVRTIPVATEFRRFDVLPRPRIVRAKRSPTWLFVGRVSPNKGIEALIQAFEAFLGLEEDAALVVLGKYDRSDPYYNGLKCGLMDRGTDAHVTLTGYVDESGIVAYYRTADVFVSMSEHEGFCVPLVEAMFFDVPIVAKATTAVPYTLGNAGLLLDPEADAFQVAATVYEVCANESLRRQILAAQRERRRAFLPAQVDPLIDKLAADLVTT